MDTKSTLEADLASIQVKAAELGQRAKAGTMTDTELVELKDLADRATVVKAKLVGLKNADGMAALAAGVAGHEAAPGARADLPGRGSKGYLNLSRERAGEMAAKMAAPGVKAILAAGSTGIGVDLEPEPLRTPGARMAAGLLSYFEVKKQSGADYKYIRQTVRTSNAAVVAVGGVKPTSVFTAEDVAGHLDVIAHVSEPIDKFLLEDADELQAFLATELFDGVVNAAERRVLATIAATSGVQTVTTSAGFTAIKGYDAVHNGIVKSQSLGYSPDLIVINPVDYEALRLGKNAQNDYIGGSPFDGSGDPQLWDRETFVTPAQPQGKVLVVPRTAVRVSTDEAGIRTDADPISGFDRNTVRFRTEGRFTADVRQPAGIVLVTLTA
ncbi:phage major capsid protein [uncultured Microbacterium sp.]|uniref:phage major capsid protein n=1 Tax=uncultured Microbacterium sp. TaxID=191216 RepID=UPI0025F4C9A8|nr:phage major capsid protein [uncultured Microbacterium sp.]